MTINRVSLRRLQLPLHVPYRLSYRTFTEFEPFYVEIDTDEGRHGFGDGHISPGSSAETREGGWSLSQQLGEALVGMTLEEASAYIESRCAESKVAASAFATAIEVASNNDLLCDPKPLRLPLLVPVNALEARAIPDEVEALLAEGFRTLKIKVGKDVEADLERVALIQKAVAGRATLRLDANRAFDREQGCWFASALNPESIELFEQPCGADDWASNAAVAKASTVPLMLDEPICSLADIERAAALEGVAYCKLKLKRFHNVTHLHRCLQAVRAHGMEPVLGDGLGSDITSWMEACAARDTVTNAGEFNGYLKLVNGLLDPPLAFDNGNLVFLAGYRPKVDRDALERHTVEHWQSAK